MATAGIPRIEISCLPEDIENNPNIITQNLNMIVLSFLENVKKIRYLHNSYLLDHIIKLKVRPHDDSKINNIVIEPHTFAMVNFKVGYAYGNPIKYSQTKELDDNSIRILNICDNDVYSRSIDSQVARWVYSTGIGYYFINPNGEMSDNKSPYDLFCIESDRCSKVYSSMVGHQPLFDIIVSQKEDKKIVDNKLENITIYIVEIYTKTHYYKYNMESGKMIPDIMQSIKRPENYHYLPLVEKTCNDSAIGIVELVNSMQNALDYITSNNLDNIGDIVNTILVYKNVNLGKDAVEQGTNHRTMMANGAIILNTRDPNLPADVSTIVNKLDLNDIQAVYDNLKQEMYDIAGVPLASSSVSSGGDTGSARSLGNGWENAYNILLAEINSFLVADRKLLERKISIIKSSVAFSKNFSIDKNDIAIKYNPNITDNMLTKSQSYVNFITNHMPPKMALAKSQLSNDPESEGKEIDDYIQRSQVQQDITNNGGGGMDNNKTG